MSVAVNDKGATSQADPGSFRDRDNMVFIRAGNVFRALSPAAQGHWQALQASSFFARNIQNKSVIETAEVTSGLDGMITPHRDWAVILQHEKIPFISYVYEWSGGMLRDAALLQLELLEQAVAEGFILTDGTPYNVQFQGVSPVYIDIGSFHRLDQKRLWPGYQQFLQQQLYPLMLLSLKGISYHPWLRGDLRGIQSSEMYAIFSSLRDMIRPGVFKHVWLAHWTSRSQAHSGGDGTTTLLEQDARKLISANARQLSAVIRELVPSVDPSAWSDYGARSHYAADDLVHKQRIVDNVARSRRWRLVWDLGANDAAFSRIVAPHADYVLALEGDHATVEQAYRSLKGEGFSNILPLYMDLASISSGNGWDGRERRGLLERGAPDLVLSLALIHHMVIGANVPLDRYIGWLASLGATVVLEFPTRDDPKVQELLASRDDVFYDYGTDNLERVLAQHFLVSHRAEISATRIMYVLAPTGGQPRSA